MGTLSEFIYFNKEYTGKGDFSGEESAFDAKGRVDFLNSYSAFLQRQYTLENGSEKAVKKEQIEKIIEAERIPFTPKTRKVLYIDEMNASVKERHSVYEGWHFYTERTREEDGCVVFNDNYLQPVPCAKYVFSNGKELKSIKLKIYIARDYQIKRANDSLERAPLDIETGRIIELRGGLAEILKIQFYADGRTFALVGNKDVYHHTKIYIGHFKFDDWNEVEIFLGDKFYNVRLNDGMTSNLAFTEQGTPDTLFLSGGRHPVGEWKVFPEKFVFTEKEQTVFFQKSTSKESAETELGEVRLPYKIGGYENKDKCLILRKEFTAEKTAQALLTVDTMDPSGEIFVNGKSVCKTDGFMRQCVDIQKELVDGKNLLEIVVFPRAPEILYSWHRCKDVYNAWVCGKVKIDFCEEVHIDALEVFTLQTAPEVRAKIKVRLNKKYRGNVRVFVRETYPEYGGETEIYQGEVKDKAITAQVNINAKVWSIDNPYLYAVRVQIEDKNGKEIDNYIEETGFRTIKQKEGAIFLNGEKICLKGALIMQFLAPYENICKSHVCPTDAEIVWQLCALKNMNANTARLHMLGYGTNDSRVAKYADRMGVLLIWTTRWIDSVEGVQWNGAWQRAEEYAKQMQEVINHPSIVIWEGSNEIHIGQECTDRLYDEFVSAVKSVDKTRLLSPCSHLYYGGGLYGDEGFYYQDNGKRNQDFQPTACSFGWKDPLVVRSAHTYEIMLGYGGDWKSFREQAWKSQPSLFKSKRHAYLVSEIAVMGRHDDSTKECVEYVKNDSYELKDERLALGVELEQQDWKISQAYQALSAQHIVKKLLANDVDGILWCCLSGGANDGSYFKPPIDFYGYAKYAFYVLKEMFAQEIAFNNDTAVAVGEEFTVNPVLSQVVKGENYHLTIRVKDLEQNVVAQTVYSGIKAEKDLVCLPSWKPTLQQNGYYQIEYVLTRNESCDVISQNK